MQLNNEAFRQSAAPGGRCLTAVLESLPGYDSPSVRHLPPGAPAVQVIPGTVSPLMVLDEQGVPRSGVLPDRLLLPSTTSAGRCRWVESHSDLVCYRVLGMRSVKNGKLFEDIPARSFCRLAKHALHPVNQVRRVRPTGTARHGSVDPTLSFCKDSPSPPVTAAAGQYSRTHLLAVFAI
jgi:hypothetical protein